MRDSTVVIAAVVRMRPRAIPLTKLTTRKSIHGFPLVFYMGKGLRLAVLRGAGAPLLISGQGGLFMFLLCEEFYFPSIDDQHWFFSCVPVLKLYPHFIYSASIQEGLQEESEDNLRKMTLLDQQRGLFRVLLPMRVDRLLLLISFMFTLY